MVVERSGVALERLEWDWWEWPIDCRKLVSLPVSQCVGLD